LKKGPASCAVRSRRGLFGRPQRVGNHDAPAAGRKAIAERVLSGAAPEDLLATLMDEVRALDEDIKAFKLLNRPLFDGYIQVRKIISSGGESSAAPAKTAVTPGTYVSVALEKKPPAYFGKRAVFDFI